MLEYILKRLVIFCLVIFVSTALVFFIFHYLPGEPAIAMVKYIFTGNVNVNPTNDQLQWINQRYDLDQPLIVQYIKWMGKAIHGDLGRSYRTGLPVIEEISLRLPATIILAFASIIIALIFGMSMGIYAAIKQNSIIDHLCSMVSVIGISIPSFWLGLILILVFSLSFNLTPVMGYGGPEYLILPALTLGMATTSLVTRLTRSSMLEVMEQDYIRTAKGKGLNEITIVFRHALKNSLIPVITVIGLEMGNLIGGTVIVETIFSWPGIGGLLMSSINARDIPMVQGCVIFITAIFVALNFVIDISYRFLDPRVRRD
jgi:peptide/nickel transport system permease protein